MADVWHGLTCDTSSEVYRTGMRDNLEFAYACLQPRPEQWRRPQDGYIPFGEAIVAGSKEDTNIDTKVGALDKSSAWPYNGEAVTANADHVNDGDWHTLKRTTQIVAAAKAASASGSTQPTQRASVINPPVGLFVSLDVASEWSSSMALVAHPLTLLQTEWCSSKMTPTPNIHRVSGQLWV